MPGGVLRTTEGRGAGARRCSSLVSPSALLPHDVCPVTVSVAAREQEKKEKRTYHVKSNEGIQLDEAVKVSKDNGQRQVAYIRGIAAEEPHELDDLGKGKHEDELGPECVLAAAKIPPSCSPPAGSQQKRVDGKGERGKGCKVQGVGAPWLLAAWLGLVLAACMLLGLCFAAWGSAEDCLLQFKKTPEG